MSTDVRHASTTDHRIRRLAEYDPADTTNQPAKPQGVRLPMVAFPPRLVDVDEIDEGRNVAIALLRTSLYHPQRVTHFHLQKVRGPLRQAVIRDPGDVPAKEALADIQRRLGRLRAAADLYRDVLAAQPLREHSLVMFASVLMALGEFDEAATIWEKAVHLNPWMARYAAELGLAYARAGRWHKCLVLTQSAIETFPTDVQLRRLLIEGLLHTGDGSLAEAQLSALFQLRPDEVVTIRDWFDNHPRRQLKGAVEP
jgi:tetratricopeptide (TPR) repeat protein